jgi:hypothetical protein
MTATPASAFDHLYRLSDDTGLLEHARGAIPRREHGYCLDDVARGLVVIGREPDPPAPLRRMAERYLAFVAQAQSGTGAFRNRLGYDRRWQDAPGTGDWWGRALWGLGTLAARSDAGWLRDGAMAYFEVGALQRSAAPRARAFAALGAAEVLDRYPDHEGAQSLLKAVADAAGRPGDDPRWPWPEHRLSYSNAVLAEVLMVAGRYCHDDTLIADGLRMLEWLLRTETHSGHLSPTPAGGWRAPHPRPAFDQQPIEAAALTDACARAWALTGDPQWAAGIRRGAAWFTGDNDLRAQMVDAATGGGFDGLGRDGPSANQGAESTLALLSTLQQARALHGGPR